VQSRADRLAEHCLHRIPIRAPRSFEPLSGQTVQHRHQRSVSRQPFAKLRKDNGAEDFQLLRTDDVGVRVENLFKQRRARTGKSSEQRRTARVVRISVLPPASDVLAEDFAVHLRAAPHDELRGRPGVRFLGMLEALALNHRIPSGVVLPKFVEQNAQLAVRFRKLRRIGSGARNQASQCGIGFVAVAAPPSDARSQQMSAKQTRRRASCCRRELIGGVEFVTPFVNLRKRELRQRVRCQSARTAKACFRVGRATEVKKPFAHRALQLAIARAEFLGALEQRDRPLDLVSTSERPAGLKEEGQIIGRLTQGVAVRSQRLVVPMLPPPGARGRQRLGGAAGRRFLTPSHRSIPVSVAHCGNPGTTPARVNILSHMAIRRLRPTPTGRPQRQKVHGPCAEKHGVSQQPEP
jgi:hypothetical protein